MFITDQESQETCTSTSNSKQLHQKCLIRPPPRITRKNCFRYLKFMSPLNAAICTTTYLERQKCYGRARKYYLKNNYLTLRSKVKVPQRSLWYATHHLMLMYPHIKYNWPIWKDKNVMVRTNFTEKKQKKKSD